MSQSKSFGDLQWVTTSKTRAQAVADALRETQEFAARIERLHIKGTLEYQEKKLARDVENMVIGLGLAVAGIVCIVPSLVVGAGWLVAKKARRSIASLIR